MSQKYFMDDENPMKGLISNTERKIDVTYLVFDSKKEKDEWERYVHNAPIRTK